MKITALFREPRQYSLRLLATFLVAAGLPLSSSRGVEVLLHSGDSFSCPQPIYEDQTLKDYDIGVAINSRYIYEIRWGDSAIAPLNPAEASLPVPGPVRNRVTVFPRNKPPVEGVLSQITSESILLVTSDGEVTEIPIPDTQMLRFPTPRPWSQLAELAELHDPLLEEYFPILMESPAGSGPLLIQRVLQADETGMNSDVRRTIERFPGRPDPMSVQSFSAPAGTRLLIHHITAVDSEGRLYHFLDGQFRQARNSDGQAGMQWIPPHPDRPHLLSTEIEFRYDSTHPSNLEHIFQEDVAAAQRVEMRIPEDVRIHWAVPPGTPVDFSEPEPGILAWEYQKTSDFSQESEPVLRVEWAN